MDDELDRELGRHHRPINRTPPQYQTIIKFLLMATILDSIYMSGPPEFPEEGSPCAPTQVNRRELPTSISAVGDLHGAEGDDLTSGSRSLPADVQETLRLLNISEKDYFREPGVLHVNSAVPSMLRVISVLMFNTFVFWSDFGANLVGARGLGLAPSRLLDEGSDARGPGIGAWSCSEAQSGWTAWGKASGSARTDGLEPTTWPVSLAEEAFHRRLTSETPVDVHLTMNKTQATQVSASCVSKRLPPSNCRSPPVKTSAEGSDPYGYENNSGVPWTVQLVYILTLVIVIVGVPCCPVVLENACTFLT